MFSIQGWLNPQLVKFVDLEPTDTKGLLYMYTSVRVLGIYCVCILTSMKHSLRNRMLHLNPDIF